MASAHRRAHEALSGIGDAGHACIGHHCDGATGVELGKHPAGRRRLCVVVDDEQLRLRDAGVLEQPARAPRVFAGDQVRGGERLDGPRRELGEVSDRRRDEDERGSGHSTTSSFWPTLRFQRANAPASASTTERAEKHGSPTR